MRRWPTAYAAIAFCTNRGQSAGESSFGQALGRAREFGIVWGSIGSGCEPDIADHNRIAGDDLAFVGRAIVDDPLKPVRETNRPDHRRDRAGEYQ